MGKVQVVELRIEHTEEGVLISANGGEAKLIERIDNISSRTAAWCIYIGAYTPLTKVLEGVDWREKWSKEKVEAMRSAPGAAFEREPIKVQSAGQRSGKGLNVDKMKRAARPESGSD
jgi:hypothetical protein